VIIVAHFQPPNSSSIRELKLPSLNFINGKLIARYDEKQIENTILDVVTPKILLHVYLYLYINLDIIIH
jgi:hypothetical protein